MDQQYFIEQDCESSYGTASPSFEFIESFQMQVHQTYMKYSPTQKQISVSKLQISTNEQAEVNQGLNHLKTIIKDYFKLNYQQIDFKSNSLQKRQKKTVIQLQQAEKNQKSLLTEHMSAFLDECMEKNQFVKILVDELKLINKKYIIPQITYIVVNIVYEFCFYIQNDIQAEYMLDKCKNSSKNLAEHVLNQQKIEKILFRHDDFEQIAQRDEAFHQLVFKLALIIWANCIPKSKENIKQNFQAEILNFKQKDFDKKQMTLISNFKLVDFQSNSAYFTDSQQDQENNKTVREKMTRSTDVYFQKKESPRPQKLAGNKLDIASLSKFAYSMVQVNDNADSLSE